LTELSRVGLQAVAAEPCPFRPRVLLGSQDLPFVKPADKPVFLRAGKATMWTIVCYRRTSLLFAEPFRVGGSLLTRSLQPCGFAAFGG
jgi:hypothetical protein